MNLTPNQPDQLRGRPPSRLSRLNSTNLWGGLALALGLLAISLPSAYSVLFIQLPGILLSAIGLLFFYKSAQKEDNTILYIASGLAFVAVAIFVLYQPEAAAQVLTILFGMAFLPSGLLLIYMGFRLRNLQENWLPVLTCGLISICLSAWLLKYSEPGVYTFGVLCSMILLISGLLRLKNWLPVMG
jgi:uncharacterized membrane protein HdeD (DUF308 family)